MYIVKVTLGNEIKRIAFDGTASFEELRKLVKTLFPTLADGFVLKYKDEDSDIISIFSDLELKEAFRQIEHQPAPQVLRLFVNEYIELAESKVEPKPVIKGNYRTWSNSKKTFSEIKFNRDPTLLIYLEISTKTN